ncbi:unnamed protein product [Amaranthus hypochondriacus]
MKTGKAGASSYSRPSSDPDKASAISSFNEREYQRGDEVSWYPDGEKIVRSKYCPATLLCIW